MDDVHTKEISSQRHIDKIRYYKVSKGNVTQYSNISHFQLPVSSMFWALTGFTEKTHTLFSRLTPQMNCFTCPRFLQRHNCKVPQGKGAKR